MVKQCEHQTFECPMATIVYLHHLIFNELWLNGVDIRLFMPDGHDCLFTSPDFQRVMVEQCGHQTFECPMATIVYLHHLIFNGL